MTKTCLAIFVVAMIARPQTTRSPKSRTMAVGAANQDAVISGAPFSGRALTTETPIKVDSTHAARTFASTFYRDAEGRTRMEQLTGGAGPWSGKTTDIAIRIIDTVSNVAYFVNPQNQTAVKLTLRPVLSTSKGGNPSNTANQVTTLNLGNQTIHGLSCAGTETIRMVATGAVGNAQPISITVDQWYSSDLKIVVRSKMTDSSKGVVDFEFLTLSRDPPDASLFTPPSNFAITDRSRK